MKSLYLLVGLSGAIVVLALFVTKDAVAVCTTDMLEDWPDIPCGPIQLLPEKQRDYWQGYYKFKGKEWMEEKRIEMENAILTNTLEQWRSSISNYNVWVYYKITNNVPEVPPIKQFKFGIPFNEIKCKEGLYLITKSLDGKPACVRDETKAKLIGIGWMKTQVSVQNHSTFIESTKNLKEVHLFLSMHPDAKVSVDDEWHTVIYDASGFRKHPSYQIIYHTKRLIIDLDYDGKPKASLAECGGGGVTLSGPVEPLANPDWCFPLDQSPFSNMTFNMKKPHPKDTSEPYTTIEISFGNVTATKLLPVVFSEITYNAEYMNEILVWNFELIGHNADDRRKTWDTVPSDQRVFYKITDEHGKDIIDTTRMPDNLGIPDDLHLYSMDCGLFRTIDGEFAHPTVFAVKKDASTIIAKNSDKGILPISDGKYSFEFASMFETAIKLPKNAEIISQESKQCKLVQGIEEEADRSYVDGYYTKMVFRIKS